MTTEYVTANQDNFVGTHCILVGGVEFWAICLDAPLYFCNTKRERTLIHTVQVELYEVVLLRSTACLTIYSTATHLFSLSRTFKQIYLFLSHNISSYHLVLQTQNTIIILVSRSVLLLLRQVRVCDYSSYRSFYCHNDHNDSTRNEILCRSNC